MSDNEEFDFESMTDLEAIEACLNDDDFESSEKMVKTFEKRKLSCKIISVKTKGDMYLPHLKFSNIPVSTIMTFSLKSKDLKRGITIEDLRCFLATILDGSVDFKFVIDKKKSTQNHVVIQW